MPLQYVVEKERVGLFKLVVAEVQKVCAARGPAKPRCTLVRVGGWCAMMFRVYVL